MVSEIMPSSKKHTSSHKTSTITENLSHFEKSNITSSKKDSGESGGVPEQFPVEEEIQEEIREETEMEPPYVMV